MGAGGVMVRRGDCSQSVTVAASVGHPETVKGTAGKPRQSEDEENSSQACKSSQPIHLLSAVNLAFGFRRVNSIVFQGIEERRPAGVPSR